MRTTMTGIALALFALVVLASCDEHHHEGAHVHGQAVLALALEKDGVLSGELRAPGADVYGFEHEPRDARERAARAAARTRLQNIATWMAHNKSGSCDFETSPPEDVRHGGHGEVVFNFLMKCSDLEAGSELAINIQDLFPAFKTVRVVIVGETSQHSVRLEGAVRQVRL